MSYRTRLAAVALAALTMTRSLASTTSSVQAKPLGTDAAIAVDVGSAIQGTSGPSGSDDGLGRWAARYDASTRSTAPMGG